MVGGMLMLQRPLGNITLVCRQHGVNSPVATYAEDHLGHGQSDGERVLLTGKQLASPVLTL